MSKVNINSWKPFRIDSLFDIVKGSRLTKQRMKEGKIRYVGAAAFNNGITNYIGNDDQTHPAGTLTVCYNGSIGQTYYQDELFWATDDVNVLYPKMQMSKYVALFIAPLIKVVGKNYAYSDKWKVEDMKASIIYLPVREDGSPDFNFMEEYMMQVENRVRGSVNQLLSLMGGGYKKRGY